MWLCHIGFRKEYLYYRGIAFTIVIYSNYHKSHEIATPIGKMPGCYVRV